MPGDFQINDGDFLLITEFLAFVIEENNKTTNTLLLAQEIAISGRLPVDETRNDYLTRCNQLSTQFNTLTPDTATYEHFSAFSALYQQSLRQHSIIKHHSIWGEAQFISPLRDRVKEKIEAAAIEAAAIATKINGNCRESGSIECILARIKKMNPNQGLLYKILLTPVDCNLSSWRPKTFFSRSSTPAQATLLNYLEMLVKEQRQEKAINVLKALEKLIRNGPGPHRENKDNLLFLINQHQNSWKMKWFKTRGSRLLNAVEKEVPSLYSTPSLARPAAPTQ